ncbi:MAG: hypothetical protein U5N86_01755 [Planctomycetota bacterium]|nr:hypothetical protein [Planctomycetota bacterium]
MPTAWACSTSTPPVAARRALVSPTLEVGHLSTRTLTPDLARKLAKQKADGAFDGYYIAFLLCRRAGLADRAKHYFDKAEDMVAGYELRETLLRTASKLVEVERDLRLRPTVLAKSLRRRCGSTHTCMRTH